MTMTSDSIASFLAVFKSKELYFKNTQNERSSLIVSFFNIFLFLLCFRCILNFNQKPYELQLYSSKIPIRRSNMKTSSLLTKPLNYWNSYCCHGNWSLAKLFVYFETKTLHVLSTSLLLTSWNSSAVSLKSQLWTVVFSRCPQNYKHKL